MHGITQLCLAVWAIAHRRCKALSLLCVVQPAWVAPALYLCVYVGVLVRSLFAQKPVRETECRALFRLSVKIFLSGSTNCKPEIQKAREATTRAKQIRRSQCNRQCTVSRLEREAARKRCRVQKWVPRSPSPPKKHSGCSEASLSEAMSQLHYTRPLRADLRVQCRNEHHNDDAIRSHIICDLPTNISRTSFSVLFRYYRTVPSLVLTQSCQKLRAAAVHIRQQLILAPHHISGPCFVTPIDCCSLLCVKVITNVGRAGAAPKGPAQCRPWCPTPPRRNGSVSCRVRVRLDQLVVHIMGKFGMKGLEALTATHAVPS